MLLLLWIVQVWQMAGESRRLLWSNREGYYMYLPGVFILKDVRKIPPGSVLPMLNERGEHVLKYTSGVAILQLPFFLSAKWYCQLTGKDWRWNPEKILWVWRHLFRF